MSFGNLRASQETQIVIINEGGQVKLESTERMSIDAMNCQHIRLAGAAVPGIKQVALFRVVWDARGHRQGDGALASIDAGLGPETGLSRFPILLSPNSNHCPL